MKLSENLNKSFSYHKQIISKICGDLLVFPECSLSGYNKKNFIIFKELSFQNIIKNNLDLLNGICLEKKKLVLVGAPICDDNKLFNCAIMLGTEDWRKNIYRKRDLTEDELSFFCAGKEEYIFELYGEKIGVLICRDQSNITYFSNYIEKKVDSIIILSAHYYPLKISISRKLKNIAIPIARSADFFINIYKSNAVGSFGNDISLGGSIAVKKGGVVVGQLGETISSSLFIE